MKLKVILIVLVTFFALALWQAAPIVQAEGEITTTQGETLTTATTTGIGEVIDYELERAKTAIVATLTSVTGVGVAGGAVNLFLKKKKAQLDASVNAAKKAYEAQKAEAEQMVKSTAADIAEMKTSAAKYQADVTAKIDASMDKLNATADRVEAMERAYQERETRMAALLKTELETVKADGVALVEQAKAVVPEGVPIGPQ